MIEITRCFSPTDWDTFCDFNATWRHLSDFMMYAQIRDGSKDRSAVLKQGNKIIGIIPILVNGQEMTMLGGSLPGPVVPLHYWPDVLNYLEEIAPEYGVKRAQFRIDLPGLLPLPSFTRKVTQKELEPTKGNKALLTKCTQKYTMEECEWQTFRENYERIVGRETHKRTEWLCLAGLNDRGNLQVYCIRKESRIVGVIGFMEDDNELAYAFSAFEPEAKQDGANVMALWEGMRMSDATTCDLGHQPCFSTIEHPTEKDLNIAKFKRGFGGTTVREPMSEIFFDELYMLSLLETRTACYWNRGVK